MSESEEKKVWTCAEAGQRGGARAREVIGAAGYQALGKKGGTATRDRYGLEHYRAMGARGGLISGAQASDMWAKRRIAEMARAAERGVYTVAQAALLLGITVGSIYGAIKRGRLAVESEDGKIQITAAALAAYREWKSEESEARDA